RARDLRQEPGRAGGGDQGARPSAAVESLRGSAIHLRRGPHRALGPLRPSRRAAEIRHHGRLSDDMVVGSRQGGQDRRAGVTRTAVPPRRDALALGAGALASAVWSPARAQDWPERHGMSAFGDLKYAADFKHFDYVNPDAPKGGRFSHMGPSAAFN